MHERTRLRILWTVATVVALGVAAPLWGPMQRAWSCYLLHASSAQVRAEIMHKLEGDTIALQLISGPQRGEGCTARTSLAHHEAVEIGDVLAVVYSSDRPGDCVLESTIENSRLILGAITIGVGCVFLLILGLTLGIRRCLTATGVPRHQMEVDAGQVVCPVCGAKMVEGYLPLLAGLHWRDAGAPIGLPHALTGLPGTVGLRRRALLHAFRCGGCEVVTLQYGEPPRT